MDALIASELGPGTHWPTERVPDVGKAAFFATQGPFTDSITHETNTTARFDVLADRGLLGLLATVPGGDEAALRMVLIRLGAMLAGRLQGS